MSVDLSLDKPAGALNPLRPGADQTVNDLIVIFGGWGPGWDPQTGGKPLPDSGSGTSDLVQQLKALSPAPFHRTLMLPMEGSLPSKLGVTKALHFITMNFDPRGDLIIYGYSAGGTDALSLCRQIGANLSAYGLSSGQLQNATTAAALKKRGIEDCVPVRVDLLITVDAAAGPGSARVDRTVPVCVRRNLNYFQTTESRIFSRGGPNAAQDNSASVIENNDLTGTAEHATIDDITIDPVLSAIRGELGIEAVPPVSAPGSALG